MTATAVSTTPGSSSARTDPLSSGNHYGSRIVQADDGNLFVSLGEHFGYRDQAQNLGNHLGKLIRIAPDGSVPAGNPFAGRANAKPEIWSYGHRNEQGSRSIRHRASSGNRHGPRGGDEVNIIGKGKNYGWPVIGYGIDYNGTKSTTALPGTASSSRSIWVPSIAPSGMAFYTGKLFPKWTGSLFTGALAGTMLVRLSLNGDTVTGEERLLQNLHGEFATSGRAGRRAVAADGQFLRADFAGGASASEEPKPGAEIRVGNVEIASGDELGPDVNHAHLWKIKNAPAAIRKNPSA